MNKRPTVEYVGSGVVVTDDTVNNRTVVTVAGGGGSTPTGTGFVTVTSGVFDAASKPYGAGIPTFLATPSSANLIAALTDETGTGFVVFHNTPTLTTPKINNPGGSFQYAIAVSAIIANRTITLPLLTANDVFVFQDFTQTLTNKTMVLASNTITDTSATTGDLMRHNGTRFVRLPRGTANQLLATNGAGTDIGWATVAGALGTNVASGTNFLSIGVNPAAAGGLRLANATAVTARNAANSADFNLINADSGGQVNVGDSTAFMSCVGSLVTIFSNGSLYLYSAGAQSFVDDGTTASFAHPINGLATPWGAVDGQVIVAVAASNITLTSAQYNTKIQKFTGTPAAQRDIIYPLPADDAHSYMKIIWNQTTVAGIQVKCSSGLGVTLPVNDAPHVILFTPAGAVRIT